MKFFAQASMNIRKALSFNGANFMKILLVNFTKKHLYEACEKTTGSKILVDRTSS